MNYPLKIILGSASKGRRMVLKQMGYKFEVMPSDIDEKAIRADDPQRLALLLARAKADALLPYIKESSLLITSDQVVLWSGRILEKPENEAQAREYLAGYAAAPAETVTAVVVINTKTGVRHEGVDTARVFFSPIQDAVIEALIRKGDIYSQAGGFSITEPMLQPYIKKVEGERESVIGLPKALTERILAEAGGENKP